MIQNNIESFKRLDHSWSKIFENALECSRMPLERRMREYAFGTRANQGNMQLIKVKQIS